MAADGFVSLRRKDVGMTVVFLDGVWRYCPMTGATTALLG